MFGSYGVQDMVVFRLCETARHIAQETVTFEQNEDFLPREKCPQLAQNDTLIGVPASKDCSSHGFATEGVLSAVIE